MTLSECVLLVVVFSSNLRGLVFLAQLPEIFYNEVCRLFEWIWATHCRGQYHTILYATKHSTIGNELTKVAIDWH